MLDKLNPTQEQFLEFVTQLSAFAVKADNQVGYREMDHIHELFNRHFEKFGIKKFLEAMMISSMVEKINVANLRPRLENYFPSFHEKCMVLSYLYSLIVADLKLSPQELEAVKSLGNKIGISEEALDQIFEFYQNYQIQNMPFEAAKEKLIQENGEDNILVKEFLPYLHPFQTHNLSDEAFLLFQGKLDKLAAE